MGQAAGMPRTWSSMVAALPGAGFDAGMAASQSLPDDVHADALQPAGSPQADTTEMI